MRFFLLYNLKRCTGEKLKLFKIGYFLEVCKQGSISKAAETLYVSQPAVSSAVKELEDEFGVKLLTRQSNRITITAAGEYFKKEAEKIIGEVDTLTREMQAMGGGASVRLAVPPMIGAILLPGIYNGIKQIFPKINVEIIECASLKARELAAAGDADAAMAVLNNITDDALESFPLFRTELVFCVNKRHELAGKGRIAWEELENRNIILMKDDSFQNTALKEKFSEKGVKPNILLYSNQLNTIKNFIVKSDSGAFLFRQTADGDPDIAALRLEDAITFDAGVVRRKAPRPFGVVRNVIDFIKDFPNKNNL